MVPSDVVLSSLIILEVISIDVGIPILYGSPGIYIYTYILRNLKCTATIEGQQYRTTICSRSSCARRRREGDIKTHVQQFPCSFGLANIFSFFLGCKGRGDLECLYLLCSVYIYIYMCVCVCVGMFLPSNMRTIPTYLALDRSLNFPFPLSSFLFHLVLLSFPEALSMSWQFIRI